MQYKYFYLKQPETVGGVLLKERECYKLTEENYDEVIALCRSFKAVIAFEKIKLAKEKTRPATVREVNEHLKHVKKKDNPPTPKEKVEKKAFVSKKKGRDEAMVQEVLAKREAESSDVFDIFDGEQLP